MKFAQFRQEEFNQVQAAALDDFKATVLGERPTYESVDKVLYNENPINILEWLALLLLVVVAIVTIFTIVSVAAIPMADSFVASDAPIAVRWFVRIAFAALFALMSTSGIVYYKLMDETDASVAKHKRLNSRLLFTGGWQGALMGAGLLSAMLYLVMDLAPLTVLGISVLAFFALLWKGGLPSNFLQWSSPRLYGVLTYLTAIWLFELSSHGAGSVFAMYLKVLVEIALTYLVADLIRKRQERSKQVHLALQERAKDWDTKLDGASKNPRYLEILFRELRAMFFTLERPKDEDLLKRRPRLWRVNAHLEQAPAEQIEAALLQEYRRLNGGENFAASVLADTKEAPIAEAGKRVPPRGDARWTAASLTQDFIVRGLSPNDNYNEQNIATDYDTKHKPRSAFRAGARDYFK